MRMNQPQDSMEKLTDLFIVAQETGVSETDWFTQEFGMLCARFDSFRFQKLMQRVLSSNSIPSLLNQVFRNPRTEEEIDAIRGDYQFGTIVNTDFEAGLGEKAANQHTVIAGAPGHGKTTLLNRLLESILEKNRIRVWIIDPKNQMRDFRHLIRKHTKTIVIHLDKLFLNIFGAIKNVPMHAIKERAAETLADCWGVLDASQGVIIGHLEKIFQQIAMPCFQDLASSILSEKSQRYGRKQGYLDTLEVRINSMTSIKNNFACRIDYFDSLYEYNVIFEVGGISDQALRVLVPFIIMKLSLYKTYNASKKLSHLLLFEEAQAQVFSKILEQRARTPTVASLATQARSYGLGLCILAQNPATKIITEMLSNSANLICFHIGGTEVRGMSECMGLNYEQTAMLQHLQPGECIFKTSLGYTEPVLVQVRNVDNTPPSDSEVERLMQPVWDELLAQVVPLEQKEEPALTPAPNTAKVIAGKDKGNAPNENQNQTDSEFQSDDKIFLKDVELRQYEYTEDRYDQCSISRSRAVKAKARLIRLGYLEEVTIKTGRRGSQPTMLRLTEKAAASLGIHSDKGKGSLLHTWHQQFVLHVARQIPGLKARIEDMSADISLSNGGGNDVAVEITLHDSNIQRNIERNFSKGYSEVWLAVKDSAMLEKVKSVLASRILQQGTVRVILLEELALEIRKRFSNG